MMHRRVWNPTARTDHSPPPPDGTHNSCTSRKFEIELELLSGDFHTPQGALRFIHTHCRSEEVVRDGSLQCHA